ncbi:hypothetical protein [Pendulispora brunnea]|uniref:hypothetical protein n=1 Tax=Pendulispora brunnea TaxID=2905690 RepID=UPI00374E0940
MAAAAKDELGKDPRSGALFLFVSKTGHRLKAPCGSCRHSPDSARTRIAERLHIHPTRGSSQPLTVSISSINTKENTRRSTT